MAGVVAEIPDGSNQFPMAAVHSLVAAVAGWAAVADAVVVVAEGPVQNRVHREYSSTLAAANLREPMDGAILA